MNRLEKQICKMYKSEINEDRCQICYQQDKKQPNRYERCHPQSLWHIGKNLANLNQDNRLVFVGKTSWNTRRGISKDDRIRDDKAPIINCLYMGEQWFNEPENYRYWHSIRNITNELKLNLDDIAITNLAKCNLYNKKNNSYVNLTDDVYFQNCIKIFEKEIQIIRPTHIIFFTNDGYDELINPLKFWFKDHYWYYHDFHNQYYRKTLTQRRSIKKQNRTANWWHRAFYNNRKQKNPSLQFLRTRHPQGAPEEFEKAIVRWVENTTI